MNGSLAPLLNPAPSPFLHQARDYDLDSPAPTGPLSQNKGVAPAKKLALVDPNRRDRPLHAVCWWNAWTQQSQPPTPATSIHLPPWPALKCGGDVPHSRALGGPENCQCHPPPVHLGNLYSQVAELISNHCAICVEKQRVDLKHGVHVPLVLHDQGEVVYVDLLGPFSNHVSPCQYLLSMMDGFSRYVIIVPPLGRNRR